MAGCCFIGEKWSDTGGEAQAIGPLIIDWPATFQQLDGPEDRMALPFRNYCGPSFPSVKSPLPRARPTQTFFPTFRANLLFHA